MGQNINVHPKTFINHGIKMSPNHIHPTSQVTEAVYIVSCLARPMCTSPGHMVRYNLKTHRPLPGSMVDNPLELSRFQIPSTT